MSPKIKIKRKRTTFDLLGFKDVKRFFTCLAAVAFLILPVQAKTSPKKTTEWSIEPHEKKWLEKFFNDIMLRERGIYTLLGSKPMAMIVLDLTPEEEIQEAINQMSEEEKKELIKLDGPYDLPENWKKWEKIKSRFPISNFLFFKKSREDDPLAEDIYLINIQQTAFTIQENYELFKKYVEEDFDPLEAVFEIGNEKSTFWQATSHNSALLGILFGFGKKNAQCFDWKHWSNSENNEPKKTFTNSLRFVFSNNPRNFRTTSIKHFDLPAFASFSPQGKDEVIIKYEKERNTIQKHYKGKDFVLETLKQLASN